MHHTIVLKALAADHLSARYASDGDVRFSPIRFTSALRLGTLRPLRWHQIATDQIFVADQAATMLGNDPYDRGRCDSVPDWSRREFFDSELAKTVALSAVELTRAATSIAMMRIDE